jgi:hypothetical protein
MGEWRYRSTILTSALDKVDWSISRPCRFTSGESPRYPLDRRLGLKPSHYSDWDMWLHSVVYIYIYNIPRCRVYFQKFVVSQLMKKFPISYNTRRSIAMFTRAHHWTTSWVSWIQSTSLHPISMRCIIILSTQSTLRRGLTGDQFVSTNHIDPCSWRHISLRNVGSQPVLKRLILQKTPLNKLRLRNMRGMGKFSSRSCWGVVKAFARKTRKKAPR